MRQYKFKIQKSGSDVRHYELVVRDFLLGFIPYWRFVSSTNSPDPYSALHEDAVMYVKEQDEKHLKDGVTSSIEQTFTLQSNYIGD